MLDPSGIGSNFCPLAEGSSVLDPYDSIDPQSDHAVRRIFNPYEQS